MLPILLRLLLHLLLPTHLGVLPWALDMGQVLQQELQWLRPRLLRGLLRGLRQVLLRGLCELFLVQRPLHTLQPTSLLQLLLQ